jgi:hypothetical protein
MTPARLRDDAGRALRMTTRGRRAPGFTVAATVPKVSFRDGVLTNSGPGRTAVSNVDSTAHLEQHTPEGTVSAECAGSTA